MEKNGLTLPTWNTLKTTLFQFNKSTSKVVRTDSTRSNSKPHKEDSLSNECVLKAKFHTTGPSHLTGYLLFQTKREQTNKVSARKRG